MKILAIETSCDETAAAVLEVKNGIFNLKSNIVSSQEKLHAQYGGIVPEVAARKQMEMIIPIIEKVVETRHGASLQNIDYIAVTQGPGLITSLTVGVETAKTLAYVLNKPLVAVNHLAGHIYSNFLENRNPVKIHNGASKKQETRKRVTFPILSLIVSGGHTMLVLQKKHLNYKIIGQTLDDAVGEAFDKVAKILGLGYPGGPIISKLAATGNPTKFNLPRPMVQQQNFNFSFSGLKTAVLYLVNKCRDAINRVSTKADFSASFQQACVDVLVAKTLRAIKKYGPKSFLLGGGVAANLALRKQLQEKISEKFPAVNIFIPDLKFTGDNAAMIAVAAYFKIKAGKFTDPKKLKAEANLKI